MKRIVVDLSEEEFEVAIDALESHGGEFEQLVDITNDIIDKLYDGAKELS